ncbi:MAG: NfeD family protein [Clostridia bacterium]|nr:NfeD family protein [Clostridia bacterium]
MNGMMILWIAAILVFAVAEALTVQLVTVWFALGAAAALIANAAHLGNAVQFLIFIGVSLVALVATRPFVRKISKVKKTPTNYDRVIGKQAIVTAEIDNIKGSGKIKISGGEWTAQSENSKIIPVGKIVEVIRIEGVKAIVKEIKEEE